VYKHLQIEYSLVSRSPERAIFPALRDIAAQHNVTPVQLAIAWVLARGENIVPVIGARKRSQLEDALGALSIQLSASDLEQIERAVPAEAVAGTRYDERQMQVLDSER
jgi:aryl-alcohol dehydrogenase-like predicted oxidoreductase